MIIYDVRHRSLLMEQEKGGKKTPTPTNPQMQKKMSSSPV
jgi:hypothetical protein